ncbi:hypothetical protein FACS189468_8830 [Spirochaetia bacterium]|nr:hypothetical protein FACS189468_8830 [Spirochaetia bacterium]
MTDTFIEETIIHAVKSLLVGRVNELLEELEDRILPIEFSETLIGGDYAVCPEIQLRGAERSEKDRIVQLDAYVLTITFSVPEHRGERDCYAYAGAVELAIREDPTLGGNVDQAVMVSKKYTPPLHPRTGDRWEIVITLRVTTEEG